MSKAEAASEADLHLAVEDAGGISLNRTIRSGGAGTGAEVESPAVQGAEDFAMLHGAGS